MTLGKTVIWFRCNVEKLPDLAWCRKIKCRNCQICLARDLGKLIYRKIARFALPDEMSKNCQKVQKIEPRKSCDSNWVVTFCGPKCVKLPTLLIRRIGRLKLIELLRRILSFLLILILVRYKEDIIEIIFIIELRVIFFFS